MHASLANGPSTSAQGGNTSNAASERVSSHQMVALTESHSGVTRHALNLLLEKGLGKVGLSDRPCPAEIADGTRVLDEQVWRVGVKGEEVHFLFLVIEDDVNEHPIIDNCLAAGLLPTNQQMVRILAQYQGGRLYLRDGSQVIITGIVPPCGDSTHHTVKTAGDTSFTNAPSPARRGYPRVFVVVLPEQEEN